LSRSKIIFGLIAAEVPGVVLCKDMLVVVPTEHILRGFLLETTMERDMVYLWRVVTPLYRRMRHAILDYSTRIPEGDKVHIDRKAYQKSAHVVRGIIENGHLDYLRRVRGPQDFLQHASWITDGSPILQRLDKALTDYLVGDVQEPFAFLRALNAEVNRMTPRQREHIGPLFRQIRQRVGANPEALRDLLDEWEEQNVHTLDLEPSRNRFPRKLGENCQFNG
jgi:hypothetical protein